MEDLLKIFISIHLIQSVRIKNMNFNQNQAKQNNKTNITNSEIIIGNLNEKCQLYGKNIVYVKNNVLQILNLKSNF